MISQPLVARLPGLKSRVSSALRATADAAVEDSSEVLEELTAAVEELEVVADELAEAEHALDVERRRYLELFDQAPDGYLVVDAKGVVREANSAASVLLGVAGVELIGKPLAVYLAGGEAHKLHERLAAGIPGGATEWETRVHPRGLPEFRASIRARAMTDAAGRRQGARLLVHDISARLRAVEQERQESAREAARLRAYAERLEALERLKADFLSLISHELRSPVTLIHGYLSMMLDGSLGDVGERARGVLPIALGTCEEITTLIEQAVQTAALDGGLSDLDLHDQDLRELATRAVSAAKPFAAMAGRSLRLVVAERPVPVSIDGSRIRTILRNLIENALKYSWEGSEVRCEVGARGDRATVAVADQGPGIPVAQLERLFTRFGRVTTPETRHIGGTGLGLYLSRELARLHGGDLDVETVEGEGSTFTLSLPVSATR